MVQLRALGTKKCSWYRIKSTKIRIQFGTKEADTDEIIDEDDGGDSIQTNEYLTGTQHHYEQTEEANDISHYLTPNLPVEDVEPSAEEPLTHSMRGNEELDETVFGNTAAGDFVEQEESISHYFTPVSRMEEDHLLTYGELPDSSIVAST